MSELLWAVLILAVAFLFFGLIPGLGAFSVRARWRIFRRRIEETSLYPFLSYSDLSREGHFLGNYRVFGTLEAIQGRNRIWVNGGSYTVEADLEGTRLYLLPSFSRRKPALPVETLEEVIPDEEPSVVSWEQIYSLPAGTNLFMGGAVFFEEGRAVFRSQARQPLLVILYDGEKNTILQRAIWGGRQKNEYWNQFTLPSLLTGSFCMLLLAYLAARSTPAGLPSPLALALAFFPVAGLLPPGIVLYYVYQFCWKKARLLRAERDLLRLPLRYFPDRNSKDGEGLARLPGGAAYVMSRDPRLLIRGQLTIRGSSVLGPRQQQEAQCVLFGCSEGPHGERGVATPTDPMAELVLVLDEPSGMAVDCDRAARLFALLSALSVFAALTLNFLLLVLVWHLILR
jgi:hypothetical protein